ncbi:MAG: MFS transporter, partial [Chloroflexia bacterium]|nr:MFS transporter [Chloroflexia bacterium]
MRRYAFRHESVGLTRSGAHVIRSRFRFHPTPGSSGALYYGWIVVGVVCLALLVSAGVRSAPGVLIHPLEDDLGWGRSSISLGVSIGLVLFGLAGPGTGWLIDRYGPRRITLGGIVLVALSTAVGASVQELWQFALVWGALSGLGTGMVGSVLGATVATRWFVARRGLVLGAFGAATSAGFLLFVPFLMWLVNLVGWRSMSVILAACAAALFLPVLVLLRNDPADVGLQPYGAHGDRARTTDHDQPPPSVVSQPVPVPRQPWIMKRAVRVPEFWLLSGSFFVCGATSNGLIGTHFIAHSLDHGISETTAAGTLALMGGMNFVGTLTSGWLTDRYDPRKLLAVYYSLRGLSLFLLPAVTSIEGLALFAVVFGLDYIATVPPTAALTADIFGRRNVGAVFGWVFFAHQLGAALAAYGGGLTRDILGDYTAAFLAAGLLAILGGLMALRIDRDARPLM